MKIHVLIFFLAAGIVSSCNQEVVENEAVELVEAAPIVEEASVDQSEQTLTIANNYIKAMNSGDMETMVSLMHEDMVWQNEGDIRMPWIGPWKGKKAILETFLPLFMKNFKTTYWVTEDSMSSGNVAAYFGKMKGITNKSGAETKEFTYALRVKVKDGKIILWNWFEDSFEVSRAFHAN